MWGVITQKGEREPEHIEFTIKAEDNEDFIYKRLLREKRCGTVERLGNNTYKFSADVYEINELIPWIRTFIGRITSLDMGDKALERKFKEDINKMYSLYEIGGDEDAL